MDKILVVGALGKMGRGIAQCLIQSLEAEIVLADVSMDGLRKLKVDLRDSLIKFAEKKINHLRKKYELREDLISNEEIINAFVDEKLSLVECTTEVFPRGYTYVFEAIVENIEEKIALYKRLKDKDTLYFSNTSSIPIEILGERSGLTGNLIGLHFYNPVPVKPLVELVIPSDAKKHESKVIELCTKLQKKIIPSNDIAGFIGNGYFLHELLFAANLVDEMKDSYGIERAKALIDYVTEKLLMRPMGLYRLTEFIGVETTRSIGKIMGTYLPDPSLPPKYLDIDFKEAKIQDLIKDAPLLPSWKEIKNHPDKNLILKNALLLLNDSPSESADIARRFLFNLQLISSQLVKRGIAQSSEDVDTILTVGFDHLYGPTILPKGMISAKNSSSNRA